jgi:hypothetical protein
MRRGLRSRDSSGPHRGRDGLINHEGIGTRFRNEDISNELSRFYAAWLGACDRRRSNFGGLFRRIRMFMQHRLSSFLCCSALRHANGHRLIAHRHLGDPEVRQNATGSNLLQRSLHLSDRHWCRLGQLGCGKLRSWGGVVSQELVEVAPEGGWLRHGETALVLEFDGKRSEFA